MSISIITTIYRLCGETEIIQGKIFVFYFQLPSLQTNIPNIMRQICEKNQDHTFRDHFYSMYRQDVR